MSDDNFVPLSQELRALLASRSVIDLTTTGRVTGQKHRIEIWYAYTDPTLFMLSGGGSESDWVRNIIANPGVLVHVDDHDIPGRARVIFDEHESELARTMVFGKYNPGYGSDLTTWRNRSLPIAIDLY